MGELLVLSIIFYLYPFKVKMFLSQNKLLKLNYGIEEITES